MPQASDPPSDAANLYVAEGPEPLVIDTFTGLNTSASRAGIRDKQLFICDGFFPLGKDNLRTLPGVGKPIYKLS